MREKFPRIFNAPNELLLNEPPPGPLASSLLQDNMNTNTGGVASSSSLFPIVGDTPVGDHNPMIDGTTNSVLSVKGRPPDEPTEQQAQLVGKAPKRRRFVYPEAAKR